MSKLVARVRSIRPCVGVDGSTELCLSLALGAAAALKLIEVQKFHTIIPKAYTLVHRETSSQEMA
jgi:hypothetical protein